MANYPQDVECTQCDPPRKFKSLSGLRGHAQFKHGDLADRPSDGKLASPQSSRMDLLGAIDDGVRQLLDGQQEMLEAAQRTTDQVSQAVLAALSSIEQQLRSLREQELLRERKVAIGEMSAIPGVRESLQYEHWATQRNNEGPDDPVPTSWLDVPIQVGNLPENPVVRDVIEKFQFWQQILEIET